MATALEQVRDYTGQRVQVRLRHRRRGGSRPDRAERGRGPPDLGQEGRAGVDDRVAAGGLPALADHGRADLAEAALSRRSTTRRSATTRRPSRRSSRSRWTRSTPRSARPTTSSASRSASRRSWPASRSTTCSTASRSRPPSGRSWASSASIFCSISEAIREHPELVRQYLGSVVPQGDNFFAALNSAVFSDGSFVYVPKGVRCPMELSTYFRINAADTGQFERTLIIADEGAYVSYLEGCTAPHARREPAARGRGRADHAGRGRDQVLDRAELVSRRQGRQGRHLQLRHQARRLPRPQVEDQLDPGRDRLGDHLEVPVLHPAGRRLGGRVLLGGGDQQPPAGRHRHQDDPHRQEHPLADRRQGHRRRPLATAPIAAWCGC